MAARRARACVQARQEAKQLRAAELPLLERDARLSPNSLAIQYRWAMALYLSGDENRAESTLQTALKLDPIDERVLFALALLYQKQQRWEEAEFLTQRLLQQRPTAPQYRQLLQALRARQETP